MPAALPWWPFLVLILNRNSYHMVTEKQPKSVFRLVNFTSLWVRWPCAGILQYTFPFPDKDPSDTSLGLPRWHSAKEPACLCKKHSFDPWVRTIPWSRKWPPTPVFLPGKLHGQRSLVDYSPGGLKESNTAEPLSRHTDNPLVTWGCVGYTLRLLQRFQMSPLTRGF